ncbi:MAG: hypothetical protein ACFFCY_00230 [Promethearchaeota archaeon]
MIDIQERGGLKLMGYISNVVLLLFYIATIIALFLDPWNPIPDNLRAIYGIVGFLLIILGFVLLILSFIRDIIRSIKFKKI